LASRGFDNSARFVLATGFGGDAEFACKRYPVKAQNWQLRGNAPAFWLCFSRICRTVVALSDPEQQLRSPGTPSCGSRRTEGSYWQEFRRALVIPLVLLLFFLVEPHWLNSSVGSRLISSCSGKVSAETKAEVSAMNFEAIGLGLNPEYEAVREIMVRYGINGRFLRLHWSLWGSLAVILVLSTAAIAIYCLSLQAMRSEDRLIQNYKLAWKIAIGTAVIELVLLVPLFTNAVYEFLMIPLFEQSNLLVAIIGASGCMFVVVFMQSLLRKTPQEISESIAKEVTPDQSPKLWEAMRRIAQMLQTKQPDHIVVGIELNFYLTEFAFIHNTGRTSGRTLYLSYPLLNQLTEPEVLAVVAHELDHFIGEHTRVARELYPLQARITSTLAFLQFFKGAFGRAVEAALGNRELQADQNAAALTSADTIIRTLLKLEVFSEAYKREHKQVIHQQGENPFRASLSTTVRDQLLSDDGFWNHLSEKQQKHPLDSHPALGERLAALNRRLSAEWARQVVEAPVEESAFARWFSGAEQLFERDTSIRNSGRAAERASTLN